MDWYNNERNSASFKNITSAQGSTGGSASEWKLLSNINADCQSAGKPLKFLTKCIGKIRNNLLKPNNHIIPVTYVKKDDQTAYRGCPGKEGKECNKKLIDQGNGNYGCTKCNFNTQTFNWRLKPYAQVIPSQNYAFKNFELDC